MGVRFKVSDGRPGSTKASAAPRPIIDMGTKPPLPTATVTPGPVKPQAPSNFQANTTTCDQQNYTNKLTWKDNTDNEDGYRVYRSGQLIATLGTNATQYTDNNPGGSGPYEYLVEAFNAAGSAASNPDKDNGCLP